MLVYQRVNGGFNVNIAENHLWMPDIASHHKCNVWWAEFNLVSKSLSLSPWPSGLLVWAVCSGSVIQGQTPATITSPLIKSMAHLSARALVHDWRSLLGKIGKISSWDLWVNPVLTQQKLLHDRKETLLLQMFMDTLTSADFLVPKVPNGWEMRCVSHEKSPFWNLCWAQ
jgi:hypothetical protein